MTILQISLPKMADNCILCGIVDGAIPSKKVYEDDEIMAVLDLNGAAPGHTFVFPKKHHTIIEQVPNALVGKLFAMANKVSTSIFESLDIQGTNIFLANGITAGQLVPHAMLQVIPRREGDNVKLSWEPRQLTEEEMSTVELKVKEVVDSMPLPGAAQSGQKQKPKSGGEVIADEENYLVNQLKRIP